MYSAQNLTTKMQLLYVAETKNLTIGASTDQLVLELRRGAQVPNPKNIDGFDNGNGDALGSGSRRCGSRRRPRSRRCWRGCLGGRPSRWIWPTAGSVCWPSSYGEHEHRS